jgi:hypothetical protein
LNDSIKAGLKPVTDPNDFEVVDMLGHWDGIRWEVTGEPLPMERTPDGAEAPVLERCYLARLIRFIWRNSRRIRMDVTQIDWTSAAEAMTSGAIGHHSFDPVFDYVST